MNMRRVVAALIATAVLLFAPVSMAQTPQAPAPVVAPSPVKVGIYLNPPFIMQDGDTYSGMVVDLFEDLARRGNLVPTYEAFATVRELLAATAAGDVDVAIGNLTITRERMYAVDFTFPWHDAGLRIMVDGDNAIMAGNLLGELSDAGHLQAYFWLAFVIVLATILLTLFDRKFDKEFSPRWFDGMVESFYHVMSITTSGTTARKHMFGAYGRLLSAFWLVFGVAVLAYVTSSVSSVMTAAAVGNQVSSIDDLRDRTVGVLGGGASELYAQSNGLSSRPYPSLQAAEVGLRAGEVDAVIADGMALEYYVHHIADAGLEVIGPLFDPEKYGFATPLGSPLARSLSLDLLDAHEDGTTEALRSKYLGVDN